MLGDVASNIGQALHHGIEVEWCKLKLNKTRLESAWSQRLKLNCDILLSSFTFNLHLRQYVKVDAVDNRSGDTAMHWCAWTGPRSAAETIWLLTAYG